MTKDPTLALYAVAWLHKLKVVSCHVSSKYYTDYIENYTVFVGQNITRITLNEIIGSAAVCTLILPTKIDYNEVPFLFSLKYLQLLITSFEEA